MFLRESRAKPGGARLPGGSLPLLTSMARHAGNRYLERMGTQDELLGLRQFLSALDSGEMTIRRGGTDITQLMAEDIRRDIDRIERALARSTELRDDA